MGSNPARLGGKPATNRLSYDAARCDNPKLRNEMIISYAYRIFLYIEIRDVARILKEYPVV
jgi:hypothetical protein